MTLYFDTFQIATLFVSVLLVNYLIQDGKSRKFYYSLTCLDKNIADVVAIDWLEGVLLMASYIIIALAAWFYPNIEENQC